MTASFRRTLPALSLLASALLLVPSPVALGQQPPDLSGQWEITSEIFLPPQAPEGNGAPCSFAGTADISQAGSDFSGSADLGLLGGPAECPLDMDAAVSGVVDAQGDVDAAMLDGQLGTAFFSGQFGVADGGLGGGGSVGTETGPFSGSTGTWSALLGGPPVQAIPTLTGVGLIVLIGFLAASALFVVRRRQAA